MALTKKQLVKFTKVQKLYWSVPCSFEEKSDLLGQIFDLENDYLNILCEANNFVHEAEAKNLSEHEISVESTSDN
ncbi:hypothetical protein M0802_005767 [Mischocyttarus mexicanus]|nr:hypothetical protein M0802_005767 [Mischocyttarus mexicanus]